jgi:hypothetical protein
LNKQSMGGFGQSIQEGFDDGFNPPATLGGHSRNPSRIDPSWRKQMTDDLVYIAKLPSL